MTKIKEPKNQNGSSMDTTQKSFDLADRKYEYARRVRQFVKRIPRTIGNFEDGKQLVRSSGSLGANYIEANEPLGDKDFLVHMKIARKEAKESRYWLRLLDLESRPQLEAEREALAQESLELMHIFNAIIRKRMG
jgi:four helix bundle protein